MFKHMNACPMKGKKVLQIKQDPNYKPQEKFKGIRAFMFVTEAGSFLCTRGGFYVENNFPHLSDIKSDVDYVLDGELWAPNIEDEVIAGWANSKYLTDDTSKVVFQCFDIVKYGSEDLTESINQEMRDCFRKWAVDHINDPRVIFVPYLDGDPDDLFAEITSRGGEGLIYRNMQAEYLQREGDNRPANHWYKEKGVETYDVILLGYTLAKPGKFEGMIGAICYGMVVPAKHEGDTPRLVELGRCSGMNDLARDIFTQDYLAGVALLNQVFEVKAAGQDPTSGALIEPRYVRMRPDKSWTDCIWGS